MRSAAFTAIQNGGDRVAPAREGHFQPEIQGMRALAVVAVIGAHAGLLGLQGGFIGVDVFFVISGFLITRLLAGEMAATGRIDLLAFWARRARRLLPNAYATLIGTALLALFLLPGYNLGTLAREIAFAALEVVNFYFADRAVDYFQSDSAASPILHFWSLAVEEQFYIVWPVLLAGLGLTVRQQFLRIAALLLGVIWCASFIASIILTHTDQPLAYFGTGTRLWQLATGALLAVGWRSVECLPGFLRAAMAWLGLATMLAGIALLGETLRYPGFWALLPTLGAAALIAGFGAAHPQSPLRRGLSLPVMQWLGARSYSWYLWHWPLLALPRVAFPNSTGIEIIAVPLSLVVAMAAYRWIETPIRKLRYTRAGLLPTFAGAAAGLALVIGAGYLYRPALPLMDSAVMARIAQIDAAAADLPRFGPEKCHLGLKTEKQPDCLYGDVTASRRAVLFGDSHAMHWFEPVNAAAKQTGWQLRSWTKSACPSADLRLTYRGDPYTSCDIWRDAVMAKLTGPERPSLVILSNRTDYDAEGAIPDPATGRAATQHQAEEAWREGFRKVIRRLLDAGVEVLIIRDTPEADKDYRDCLLTGAFCSSPRQTALADTPLDAQVAQEFADRLTMADFTEDFCDETVCPVMRNGVIIYQDRNHLTGAYAATFTPQMARLLQGFADEPQPKQRDGAPTTDLDVAATSALDGNAAAPGGK